VPVFDQPLHMPAFGDIPALRSGAVFGNVRATFGRAHGSRPGAAAAGAFGPARIINRGFIT
jgi:hypothetical protein